MLKEYIINLMDVNQEEMGRYVEKLRKRILCRFLQMEDYLYNAGNGCILACNVQGRSVSE